MTACLAFCVLTLAGCGAAKLPEVIETTTIAVDKDGVISSYLVSDFDKNYYNLTELTSMAIEDAQSYNTEHQTGEAIPISVEKVEMLGSGNKVLLQHKFNTAADYGNYNQEELFYGTVAEALAAGYQLADSKLISVKDGSTLTQEELLQSQEKTSVLITTAKAVVYGPGKVTYISEGAVYQEDGSVSTNQTEGTVVILMK